MGSEGSLLIHSLCTAYDSTFRLSTTRYTHKDPHGLAKPTVKATNAVHSIVYSSPVLLIVCLPCSWCL